MRGLATAERVIPRAASSPDDPHRGFRGDVEGLRAVAVGLVLLYHAGLPWLSGGFVGVDVFFVISGFLITGQLVGELHRTGRISLVRFYARRAKRLLPATAIVLVTTAALVVAFVSKIQWQAIGGDIIASALYFVNWRLANRSVDYLAEDIEPSPVQHFWSLAVEEQYYLVWPLLLLVVTLWARRRGRSLTGPLCIGLALVGLPSFLWAVYQTNHNPATAFFVTTTRIWELAIGAGVAIAVRQLSRMPPVVAMVLGWAGLAAIAAAAALYSTQTPWPGYAAAVPTLGAAAVIATGVAAGHGGPVLVLGTGLFRWVGALSYSLYLWHWPLIVIATAYWGELSITRGFAVAAFSVIPAWLTYRLVENPMRYSQVISRSPRLSLSLGANFTLLGVLAGLLVSLAFPSAMTSAMAGRGPAAGAAALAEGTEAAEVDVVEWMTPDPLRAPDDVPSLYAKGCQTPPAEVEPVACEFGNPNATTLVAVVGDSKVAQWMPAIELLADQNDWRGVLYIKSACAFSSSVSSIDGAIYQTCAEWNAKVLAELTGPGKPDFVITSHRRPGALPPGSSPDVPETREAMAAGLRQTWTKLTAQDIKVIVLLDTPSPSGNVYECVAENVDHLTECAYDRGRGVRRSAATTQLDAAKDLDDVEVIDLTHDICPTDQCPPVIGNVLIYRQGTHLTATYVESLAPYLEVALHDAGLPIS
jgi:peptidoglycan/LPS O-acetylase OafA/YrhL